MKRLLIALVMCGLLVGVVAADTAIFYTTNSTDGYVFRTSENSTFASIVTSAGTDSYDPTVYCRAWILTDTFTDRYKTNARCVNWFDTSSLPDNAVVTSAVVQERVYTVISGFAASTTNVTMVGYTVDGSISSDDYDNFGNTVYANEFKVNTIATGNLLNFTMNSFGISNVSKTGNTGIMFLTNHDQKQTAPVWSAGGNLYAGAAFNAADSVTFIPFITVTYTPPPPSLESLTNSSPSCNSLQFNYTVPSGVGNILIYRNNTQLANETNSSVGVLWEGLPESTAITFSARTCSIDGLVCNSTWTNMTTNTGACGVAPVANFTANATNICIGDSVQFNDTSENIPTSWNWSFGDGNYLVSKDPLFRFNVPGTFNINLTATNAYGSDFENKTGYIVVGSCEQPTPTPTPTPTLCYYVNATGATIADNFTNLSFNAGSSSWGVTVWNQSEGNISWWQCGNTNVSTGDGGGGGGEATGAALGLVGGLIGALIVLRRDEK